MEEPEILIVDDNPEIREVAMVLLQGEGFTVDEAGDGKEALDKIEHGAYDLILLDVMMPGLNGYQTCMEIRKNQMSQSCFSAQELRWKIRSWGFQRRRRLSSQAVFLSGADQQSKSPGAAISCISGQRPEDTGRKMCSGALEVYPEAGTVWKTEKRFL